MAERPTPQEREDARETAQREVQKQKDDPNVKGKQTTPSAEEQLEKNK